jgi:hypothetical protein
VLELLGDFPGILAQRRLRAQQDRAIGPPLGGDLLGAQPQRLVGRERAHLA